MSKIRKYIFILIVLFLFTLSVKLVYGLEPFIDCTPYEAGVGEKVTCKWYGISGWWCTCKGEIDFDDGTVKTGRKATHKYQSEGTYKVKAHICKDTCVSCTDECYDDKNTVKVTSDIPAKPADRCCRAAGYAEGKCMFDPIDMILGQPACPGEYTNIGWCGTGGGGDVCCKGQASPADTDICRDGDYYGDIRKCLKAGYYGGYCRSLTGCKSNEKAMYQACASLLPATSTLCCKKECPITIDPQPSGTGKPFCVHTNAGDTIKLLSLPNANELTSAKADSSGCAEIDTDGYSIGLYVVASEDNNCFKKHLLSSTGGSCECPEQCTDTDGGWGKSAQKTKGTCTDDSGSRTDYCIGNTDLKEYGCTNTGCSSQVVSCTKFSGHICKNGECTKTTTSTTTTIPECTTDQDCCNQCYGQYQCAECDNGECVSGCYSCVQGGCLSGEYDCGCPSTTTSTSTTSTSSTSTSITTSVSTSSIPTTSTSLTSTTSITSTSTTTSTTSLTSTTSSTTTSITCPTLSITYFAINNDKKYTSSKNVNLETQPLNADECRWRNKGGNWTNWASSYYSKDWVLPLGQGIKIVEVECRENTCDQVDSTKDNITLDSTPPKVNTYTNPSIPKQGDLVSFHGKGSDSVSGVNFVELTIVDNVYGTNKNTCLSPSCDWGPKVYSAGDQVTYKAKVGNNAGLNNSKTKSFIVGCTGFKCLNLTIKKKVIQTKSGVVLKIPIEIKSLSVNKEKVELSVHGWKKDYEFNKTSCTSWCAYPGGNDRKLKMKTPQFTGLPGKTNVDLLLEIPRKMPPSKYQFTVSMKPA